MELPARDRGSFGTCELVPSCETVDELLAHAACVVAMHPDQAAWDVLEYANACAKPFAMVCPEPAPLSGRHASTCTCAAERGGYIVP